MSKKESLKWQDYTGAVIFVIIPILLDLYLSGHSRSAAAAIDWKDKVDMWNYFEGSFLDWTGIILFNASCLAITAGFIDFYKILPPPHNVWPNYAAAVLLAGTLALMYLA